MGLRALSLDELWDAPVIPAACGATLALSGFSYTYKRGAKALDIPALSLPKGGAIAVIGANGAGKSTFARCLCGLNKGFRGTLVSDERVLGNKARRKKCFMVMQDVNHQLFTESVIDEVLLGMPNEDTAAAHEILNGLQLRRMKDAHPMSLSGGEKQRVAIAAAIASGREIIVFDEPTSGLDFTHMRRVAENIRRLRGMGKTVLVVTHDPELILLCCTHALKMENGAASGAFSLDADGRREMLAFFMGEGGEILVSRK